MREKVRVIKLVFYPLGMATLIAFFAILITFPSVQFRQIDIAAFELLGGNSFVDGLSLLGDQWVIMTISVSLIVYLWIHRKNYRGMLFVFLTAGVGNVLNQLLKRIYDRERPDFPHGLESFSFPSGHAMVGLLYLFTVAYFMAENIASKSGKWLVWGVAAALALGVGLSRVAGGEHYFSDVLAGWCAGYSWFIAIAVWYETRERLYRKQMHNE
ncbi:phosphatase PAP2 family protein [Planococcus shixiaomingii]|uniref:phosphatase PAP2 family protein n=1 Tax=Planococcus shixiaomingii TaxID=3058393 RepID=UPI00260DA30A|nr:phosphatase PAP2 family protein [Planococcus sp. N022]WKA55247.1 phosphatase PAP2 family protein [Planococcus sp. N022]